MDKTIDSIDSSFEKIECILTTELTTLIKVANSIEILKLNLQAQELKYQNYLLQLKSKYSIKDNDSLDIDSGKINRAHIQA